VLIEAAGWRLLVDPTFDPPGRVYPFGLGTSSRKLAGPALSATDLGPVDAVLLSHDHHGDNLDDAGRALLPSVATVVTTVPGARRLTAGSGRAVTARGLAPWEITRLEAPGRTTIEITATPARHGPPLSRPVAGHVIGFALRWEGQRDGALWVTGDTVLFKGVRQVTERLQIGAMLLHLGCVRFSLTGPVHYSMTAREAVTLLRLTEPAIAFPVHYEGGRHFKQGRVDVERALAGAPVDLRNRVRWLPMGEPVDATV
jgi:L-ascorbate metabolism protein UlaG (beta-lactamase superfamily)